MPRYCYCSQIKPGKSDAVKAHWQEKSSDPSPEEIAFWTALGMTGFESWLQHSPQGDFLIHCLEGESLESIFKGLRQQIEAGNAIATRLHLFYQEVLGKDYRLLATQPHIECLLDIALQPTSSESTKKGYFFPLLPHKEEAHRRFRQESMTGKRRRHEASMKAFGVHRLTSWLQQTGDGPYIIVYTERSTDAPTPSYVDSPEWEEIAALLMDQTGLPRDQVSPDTEWLTRPF
jgi:hypothetical protein